MNSVPTRASYCRSPRLSGAVPTDDALPARPSTRRRGGPHERERRRHASHRPRRHPRCRPPPLEHLTEWLVADLPREWVPGQVGGLLLVEAAGGGGAHGEVDDAAVGVLGPSDVVAA